MGNTGTILRFRFCFAFGNLPAMDEKTINVPNAQDTSESEYDEAVARARDNEEPKPNRLDYSMYVDEAY